MLRCGGKMTLLISAWKKKEDWLKDYLWWRLMLHVKTFDHLISIGTAYMQLNHISLISCRPIWKQKQVQVQLQHEKQFRYYHALQHVDLQKSRGNCILCNKR